MEYNDQQRMESVYSTKVRAGRRRTYFFDVRQTKGEDYYITLTESTKKFNGEGYNRHKIFLYKEDFNRFVKGLEEVVEHVKTELMPEFDYELYEKRQEEWEAKIIEEGGDPHAPAPKHKIEAAAAAAKEKESAAETADEGDSDAGGSDDSGSDTEVTETEDDISW